MIKQMKFPIKIKKDKNGYYATCPILKGCSTSGTSYKEALANIKDAIKLYVEDLEEDKQLLPLVKKRLKQLKLGKAKLISHKDAWKLSKK